MITGGGRVAPTQDDTTFRLYWEIATGNEVALAMTKFLGCALIFNFQLSIFNWVVGSKGKLGLKKQVSEDTCFWLLYCMREIATISPPSLREVAVRKHRRRECPEQERHSPSQPDRLTAPSQRGPRLRTGFAMTCGGCRDDHWSPDGRVKTLPYRDRALPVVPGLFFVLVDFFEVIWSKFWI